MNVFIEIEKGSIIGVYVDGSKILCCSGYVIIDRDQYDSSGGMYGPFPAEDLDVLGIDPDILDDYDHTP